MKIPLSWLKEFIPLTQTPGEIAEMLTMAGLEVENIQRRSLPFEGVVVGKVTEVKKHPNAERLCVTVVTDGMEYFQVVCGASNCRSGMKTALAKVGATLTDPEGKTIKIKKSKLRGVESCGMLCSSSELGIGVDEEGKILELPDDCVEGRDLKELYSDAILEIGLTPNLNHCSSIMGVARELSALTAHPLRYPRVGVQEEGALAQAAVTVQNEAISDCPRYAARLITDVAVGPSPDWLVERLVACGIRPVNNVVDVTNYVLLEFGHPLHAFDYDQIAGKTVIIRRGKEGEKIVTIDDKERVLSPDDLLICDIQKPIALAGVMGGKDTEVTDNTKNIFLESAYFHPSTIRRCSKRHGLQTEGSRRFERGADPHQPLISLNRATALIQEICGGIVRKGIVELREESFPPKTISVSVDRINQILGTRLGQSEIEIIFQRLQFKTHAEGHDRLSVQIPTYRVDITAPIDLVEEVARIYGYNHIPKPAVRYRPSPLANSPLYDFEGKVREKLLREGLQECLTCDLISPKQLLCVQDSVVAKKAVIHLLNPNSSEQSVLRPSLLPGLLQVVKHNQDFHHTTLSAFEIGKIHLQNDNGYIEQTNAAIVLTGLCRPHHWDLKPLLVDFYDLKGICESLLASLGVLRYHFKVSHYSCFHPGRQAHLYVEDLQLGSLGEVHPQLLKEIGIENRVYFAEINLQDLLKVKKSDPQMRDLPIYPSSQRDWTVTLKEETPIEEILSVIHSVRSYLMEKISLVDIWRSKEKLGEGKKNATFNFVYRDPNRTLSTEEIDAEHARITQNVLEKLRKEDKLVLPT